MTLAFAPSQHPPLPLTPGDKELLRTFYDTHNTIKTPSAACGRTDGTRGGGSASSVTSRLFKM